MNKHQQTCYGMATLVYRLFNAPVVYQQYTTVNERLEVSPGIYPTASEPVSMDILVAGNKGHISVPGVDGIGLTGTQDHLATDASLYGQLPLVIRDMDNDLSAEDRALYCFRKVKPIDGIGGANKIHYYGYRLGQNALTPVVNTWLITRTPEGGENIVPFVPSNENLYPIPPELPTTGAITASNVSVRVSCIIKVVMNERFITEFVNAVKQIYNGDERYAIMSEFGLVTSGNRVIQSPGLNGNINFNEAIGAQIYAFTMEHKALYYNTRRLELDFDVGNQIPLFAPQSIPTMVVIP